MSCTVNHLLIERGVKMRELGHHVMEGRDNMSEIGQSRHYNDAEVNHIIQERDRLRAVNAKLLEALEQFVAKWPAGRISDETLALAREAVEEARK